MGQHLLNVKELTIDQINELLQRATFFEKNHQYLEAPLHRRFVANLFLEPSTRTKISFEIAEKRLGLETISFSSASSSLLKGETLYDTLKTIEKQGVEVAVIRLKEEGQLDFLSQKLKLRIVNAGEGTMEHPTQALLDIYTIKKYFQDLKGLNVAIIGDIAHSRVAHSNYYLLKKLGANVVFSGPSFFMDKNLEGKVLPIDEAIKQADVVMMLRVQFERLTEKLNISQEEYNKQFGFTTDRLQILPSHSIILHPAPVNRGMEMDDQVVEHKQSKIFEQVENGVWIRMAVIERAIGGDQQWQSSFKMETYGLRSNGLMGIS